MAFIRHLRPPPLHFASSCTRIRHTPWSSRQAHTSISTSSPPPTQKPYYITTPIFYPNASPHIGHLYSLVAGDVFARYQRMKGRDVVFLTGTDEHGMKIQRAARLHFGGEAGREKEFCDALSERFRDLGRRANISNTCFMRTSSEEHHRAVDHVWRDLYTKGFIYKSQYSGWYSITDECFYTDAQVSSSPPPPSGDGHCVSLETGATVEWTSEENYMFRLSAFRDALLEHYTSNPRSVYPPQYHENVLAMLGAAPLVPNSDSASASASASASPSTSTSAHPTQVPVALLENFELGDISISRPRSRLEWGVPVPDDPEQTVYVWFDALLIYLTGAGYPWPSSPSTSASTSTAARGRRGPWPADIQVIGKDILRFHAIYLPAILLALSGGSYQPPITTSSPSSSPTPSSPSPPPPIPLSHTLLTHAHWTSSQKKMSKSLGNVADPLEAMDKFGVDVARFYMMRVGGRWRGDVDWSSEQLEKHHKEIQAQLGNYFLRISSPRIAQRAREAEAHRAQEATGTKPPCVPNPNLQLLKLTLALPAKFEQCMDQLEAGQALAEVMNVLKVANKVLTDLAPWSPTSLPDVVLATRIVALETLFVVGRCLGPVMPGVSGRLLEGLGGAGEVDRLAGGREGKMEVEVERIWKRWKGRDVKGVKLF
ncbi:hypothetical protein CPB84DRAFT_1732793 [Gymnopilus junonius]|uniref:methionine--tRNA ligase n=1 Tax=Gymnopilus junonius TaxID=109634 RepID=A0A9P5TLP0_GYMJU|nr:hypothetical protein CPB84DRAFT_1732793 [Gymnopilus junonius]